MQYLVGEVKVQGIRVIEVVVLSIVVILLGQPLIERVQSDV